MCGRTACTLAPEDICKSCRYTTKDGKSKQPRWQNPPGGQYKYYQSYNVAPGSHTPVLVQKKHVMDVEPTEQKIELEGETSTISESDWVVQPMRWGLVPNWHKGDPKSVDYNMTNARSDGMLSKNTFKKPLEKGRRCVILVDGYFEWQTKDGQKQPYFIYFPQPESETNVQMTDKKAKKTEAETAEEEKNIESKEQKVEACEKSDQDTNQGSKKLLTMAGLFDVWYPKDGDAPLYSYSIITVDAHKDVSFIHHRMPAILHGEDEVRQWLDSGNVPLSKATSLIRPVDCVSFHPVTKDVGNVKNKTEKNVKPIDLSKPPPLSGSGKMMMAWLGKGVQKTEKRASPDRGETSKDEEPGAKKIKTEDV